MTNRALILAALADGPSQIIGALRSRDSDLMMQALRAMGTTIEIVDDPQLGEIITVTPHVLVGGDVDCGLAGTVMRFVPPVAALAAGQVSFDGDEYARKRPMGTILNALKDLGVAVSGDKLPFTVIGTGRAPGGEVTIDASGSSQFVSGLLLSAARYDSGMTVRHSGATLPSLPHIDMTVAMLRDAGVRVDVDEVAQEWTVHPGPIAGRQWWIEPDLSNATPFLAAAMVTGGRVRMPWPRQTTQPGAVFPEIATAMGATCELHDDEHGHSWLTLRGPGAASLRPITWDMSAIGELTPTVAALCALADGESHLYGIAHLRGHETDRLAALAREITRIGGTCTDEADGLRITGHPTSGPEALGQEALGQGALHGAQWLSYADHRMATAGAILGLVVPGIEVENIATTAKTLPGFADMWTALITPAAADKERR